MTVEQLPDYEKIANSTYVCRTQAAFERALRDFIGEVPGSKMEKHWYPRSYPSLVTLSWGYLGRVRSQCTHVSRVLAALDKHRKSTS